MIAEVTRFFSLLRTLIWADSLKPASSWTIEFERGSSKVTTTPPSHSINLIARSAFSKWHVRVTFGGEPDLPLSKKPYRVKWDDFRSFCHCIDFNQLPLLVDTVTELYISPTFSAECQRLPFTALPNADGNYAPFRKTDLWARLQEYPRRIRYPSYIGVGPTLWLSDVELGNELKDGVFEAHILGHERSYVYKSVDRDIYRPTDSDVLEQELRNLESLYGHHKAVQLVAAVVSHNPYQTNDIEGDKTPVLRGILLEHHPNGTLSDLLQSPKPWMKGHWRPWGHEITTALACLHQKGVAHMDLKPDNVVMSKGWTPILIDFSGIVGTTRDWLLPELLNVSDACSASWEVRVQSDTWALGKILSSMAETECDEEKQLLQHIAQAIEQARGLIPLPEIASWLCRMVTPEGYLYHRLPQSTFAESNPPSEILPA
jgi:hypothetical protein